MSSLLNGAKELEPRGLIRQFTKKGNYRSAVKDFEALNLFDVRNFKIPEVVCTSDYEFFCLFFFLEIYSC